LRWIPLHLASLAVLFCAWVPAEASMRDYTTTIMSRLQEAGYENLACETTDTSIVV